MNLPNDLIHQDSEGNLIPINELEDDHLYNLLMYYIRRIKNGYPVNGTAKVKLGAIMMLVLNEKLDLKQEDVDVATKENIELLAAEEKVVEKFDPYYSF